MYPGCPGLFTPSDTCVSRGVQLLSQGSNLSTLRVLKTGVIITVGSLYIDDGQGREQARSYSSPLSGLTWSGILRGGGMWHQPLQLAGRGERARFAGTLIKLLRSRPRPAKGGRLPEKGRFALADAMLPSCHAPAGEPWRQVFADPSCFRRLLGGRHPPNLK